MAVAHHNNNVWSVSSDQCWLQSPGRAEQHRQEADTASLADDASSTGNKEDDDDDEEEDGNDENFDGLNRDPERLKAFNVSAQMLPGGADWMDRGPDTQFWKSFWWLLKSLENAWWLVGASSGGWTELAVTSRLLRCLNELWRYLLWV